MRIKEDPWRVTLSIGANDPWGQRRFNKWPHFQAFALHDASCQYLVFMLLFIRLTPADSQRIKPRSYNNYSHFFLLLLLNNKNGTIHLWYDLEGRRVVMPIYHVCGGQLPISVALIMLVLFWSQLNYLVWPMHIHDMLMTKSSSKVYRLPTVMSRGRNVSVQYLILSRRACSRTNIPLTDATKVWLAL